MDEMDGRTVTIAFARGENVIAIQGMSESEPIVDCKLGEVRRTTYYPSSKRFVLFIAAAPNRAA